jgi:hypothetical protein
MYFCGMENIGFLEIRISGLNGNLDLSPDNYDIRELMVMLETAEDLLYSGDKKDRPIISYEIAEGSVKHRFKTSLQFIIGFNAVIEQINHVQNIDFLDYKTSLAFEKVQDIATKKDYTFDIKTSLPNTNELTVNRTTQFYRTETVWADADFYFYGKITDAGGKDKANIHIATKDIGIVRIQTPIRFLEEYKENMLYKAFGVHVKGKQNTKTGELDKSTLEFIELIEYQPKYNDDYLNSLIEKASKNWINIPDKDLWLREMRGSYGT